MILAPTLTLSAGSGAAIVRPTFSRDFAGEKTLNNGTGPAITFTRASGGTYFDANGVLQTASNDQPRFDHDPASGNASRGLLIEEQRTNLLLNSASLSTQTVTVTAASHALSFYGTGEIVLSGAHSATVTGSGAFPTRTTLTFTPSAGTLTATVSGTVEYAQLEAGAFATSYIPTTTAAATRSADSAVVTPISGFYNQSEGTVFATYSTNIGNIGVAEFNDGGTSSRTSITNTATLIPSGSSRVSSAVQASISVGSAPIASETVQFAFAFKADDFQAARAGTLGTADTSGSLPNVSNFRLGSIGAGTSNILNGHIRKIAYWPKRLTNTLLEQLTT